MLGACVAEADAEAEDVFEEEEDREAEAEEVEAELADALALALALEADALAEELMLALAEDVVLGTLLVCTEFAPEIWKELEKLIWVASLVSTMAKFHCPLLTSAGTLKVAVCADAETVAKNRVSLVLEWSQRYSHSDQYQLYWRRCCFLASSGY